MKHASNGYLYVFLSYALLKIFDAKPITTLYKSKSTVNAIDIENSFVIYYMNAYTYAPTIFFSEYV